MIQKDKDPFLRNRWLLGDGLTSLKKAHVAIFGLGGVGSYVVEALARSGIGQFSLVDHDVIDITNINRQLIALHSTVGQPKVIVSASRIANINPHAHIDIYNTFFLPDKPLSWLKDCSYIIDAIDTVTAKIGLIQQAQALQVPIISCMGTGNKLDPMQFEIADITQTSVCPLCRVMRRELKKRKINHCKVVFSKEPPRVPLSGVDKRTPGSVPFVPSVAGLLIASEVVKDLLKKSEL